MPSTKKTLKTCASAALSATIIATKGLKYGLTFSSGLAKEFLGGANNLAGQFAPGVKFGIGKYLFEQTEKAAVWGIDQTIAAQKWLKGKLR